MRIGVVGGSGFLGGEAIRLLESHPHAEVTLVCGGESAGKDLSQIRANLPVSRTVQHPDPALLAKECDAVFLALPHGHSAGLVEELIREGKIVIDLGSDFRLKKPEDIWTYYKREAPRQRLLDEAWYGLPEVSGPPPAGTRLISAPGCFATALSLMLAPLSRLAGPRVAVFGVTGSSGSGIQPIPGVHHSLRSSGFVSYKALVHQHIGEVLQALRPHGWESEIDFVPHSGPVVRGIHVTCVVPAPQEAVLEVLNKSYEGKPFVTVAKGPVNMGATTGSNRALIGCAGSGEHTAVFCAIDNLIKGGAGQGIQNLNLLMGWDETAGLPRSGIWP